MTSQPEHLYALWPKFRVPKGTADLGWPQICSKLSKHLGRSRFYLWDSSTMCWGLNSHCFPVVGDGHQPNRGFIYRLKGFDGHPQYKELIGPGTYRIGGFYISHQRVRRRAFKHYICHWCWTHGWFGSTLALGATRCLRGGKCWVLSRCNEVRRQLIQSDGFGHAVISCDF